MPETGSSRAVLLALVLVLAALPVGRAVAVGPTDPSVTYTWDPETGEVTDYSRHGGALPSIACYGGWSAISSHASSNLGEPYELEYRVDYVSNHVEVRDARGPVLTVTIYQCMGEVSYGPPRPSLLTNGAASSGNGSCDGARSVAFSADAPASNGTTISLDEGATVDVTCLAVRGTGSVSAPGEAPFTGRVQVQALDGQGDVVAEVTTCTMVGGSCWSGGSLGPTLDDDALDAEATSIRCEAENLLGLPGVHPAGTFACEAFFG